MSKTKLNKSGISKHENDKKPLSEQEKAINELNEGYNDYKKNHPDFAKVVERDLEGKTNEEFEKMFIDEEKNKKVKEDKDDDGPPHDFTYDYKVTTIVGPQAEAIIQVLKRGLAMSWKDDSVPGLTILSIYTDTHPSKTEYWE